MKGPLCSAFGDAAGFLVQAVRLVPETGWDSPGLGVWTVRELVAHANRGQTTVEEYLLRPRQPEPPDSGYFSAEAITARAREALSALGDDPAAAVASTASRVTALVESSPPDATIGSPAGTMTLVQYLPSRIAELTIHAIDVVRAVGAGLAPPATALQEAFAFVARRAALRSGPEVLLALTGRGPLPTGYSVY